MKFYCLTFADVNECSLNVGLGYCQQKCTNIVGSYYCSCNAGYTSLDTTALVRILLNCLADVLLSVLVTHSILYLDIDECESGNGLSPCQQTCTNTIGSYNCGCISGYALQSNGYNCSGKHDLHVWTYNCTNSSVEPPPYQTLMSVAAQAMDWDCVNRYVSMSLAHFTVTAVKAMC